MRTQPTTLNSRLRLRRAPSQRTLRSPDPAHSPSPNKSPPPSPTPSQVDRCFPLEQAKEGHDYLEAGKSRGKVLYEI